jgi:hypothetical protein
MPTNVVALTQSVAGRRTLRLVHRPPAPAAIGKYPWEIRDLVTFLCGFALHSKVGCRGFRWTRRARPPGRSGRPPMGQPARPRGSLAKQEIEKEGLRRRWRCRRRGPGHTERAIAGRRGQRTVVFLAQPGARRVSRRRGDLCARRRRVERTLPAATCEPKRCGHDGHQGQPP